MTQEASELKGSLEKQAAEARQLSKDVSTLQQEKASVIEQVNCHLSLITYHLSLIAYHLSLTITAAGEGVRQWAGQQG